MEEAEALCTKLGIMVKVILVSFIKLNFLIQVKY